MAAATADQDTVIRAADAPVDYPVAGSTRIYKHTMVCLDANGYATPAADTSGLSGVVGIAMEGRNNSSGSAGDTSVPVRSGVQVVMAATSILATQQGQMMYVVDDSTVDDRAAVTNMIPAGILIQRISATLARIFLPFLGQHQRMSIKNQ